MECLTVTQVNTLAKQMLEEVSVWIKGEVSNSSPDKYYYKYFSLKDEEAAISCVFPSNKLKALDFEVKDGVSLKVFGKLSIYEKEGRYQFKAEIIEKDGVGDLQAKIEEIKDKLQKEGLLSDTRKRKLPAIPERIAVISSKDSAAWKDFYKILNNRYPNLEVFLYDSLVQGDKAAKSVIKGLDYINTKLKKIDLIVITRGGGSLEDLMAFNDEALARAIVDSRYPVVSAIGHEKDISISDLVADLRASTPSNAAELISPDIASLHQDLDNTEYKFIKIAKHLIDINKLNLENIINNSPITNINKFFKSKNDEINTLGIRIASHSRIFENYLQIIEQQYKRIQTNIDKFLNNTSNKLEKIELSFKLNNPLEILSKGYSISTNAKGKIIKSIKDIKVGESIETKLHNGKFSSNILSIQK